MDRAAPKQSVIHLCFWRILCTRHEIGVWLFFFSILSFVPVVLMRSLVVILILLWNLWFHFEQLTIVCLDVVFLQLILLEVCVRFWICLLIVSLNLGTFCHYLFRCVFSISSPIDLTSSPLSSVIFCSPLKPILWIFISIIQLFTLRFSLDSFIGSTHLLRCLYIYSFWQYFSLVL